MSQLGTIKILYHKLKAKMISFTFKISFLLNNKLTLYNFKKFHCEKEWTNFNSSPVLVGWNLSKVFLISFTLQYYFFFFYCELIFKVPTYFYFKKLKFFFIQIVWWGQFNLNDQTCSLKINYRLLSLWIQLTNSF